MNILIIIFDLIFNTLTLFLYSYFGAVTTFEFLLYGVHLYESDWYKMPIEQQKYMILIIRNAQEDLCFTGSKLFVMDLATFSRVK